MRQINYFDKVIILVALFSGLVSLKAQDALLTLQDAKAHGVSYQNNIRETGIYNHVFWENVYHGAGVAIGDINNDGLADVFFAGNQTIDELYLNTGNFNFKNITENLNAPNPHYWSNGVTMADVNADGWLDIYVSKSGPSLNPRERQNLLYLNNKDNTFTESAKKIGLADEGYSLQTVFFDMDNDGDLDVYVMNQPPSTVQEKRQNILEHTSCDFFTDNLYKNEDGHFIKITDAAGVRNCAYGLGIVAKDFNGDGWVDLYVSNDYLVSDHLYINQQNGSFKDEAKQYFFHESLYAMGVDAADINNDELLDIFTADMSAADHYRNKANMPSMNRERFEDIIGDGNNYQYMFNALQLNNGGNNFSEIAQMAGVANTDWSWSVLLTDLDNDSHKDLLITNGIKRDVRFVDGLKKLSKSLEDGTIRLSEILGNTPSQPLKNFAFKNEKNLKFKDIGEEWGFALESFSAGMAAGDLDNDGDLDIIINNVDQAPFILKNNSKNNFLSIRLKGDDKNPFAFGAKAKIEAGGEVQTLELNPTRGYLSSSQPILIFGLGAGSIVDKLTINWGNNKKTELKNIKANSFLEIKEKGAVKTNTKKLSKPTTTLFSDSGENYPNFRHSEKLFDPFKKEVLLPHKFSQLGPALAVGDVNNDGLEDFFIGGAKDQSSELWVQQSSGEFTSKHSLTWQLDAASEDVTALIFDANNDGLSDIYVGSGSNEFDENASGLQDRLYINNGVSFVHDVTALPPMAVSTGTVQAADFDGDGDLDLFVGGLMQQQKYPMPAASFLLENKKGKFVDVTFEKAVELQKIGMIRDAVWSDTDTDGDLDLMIVGEWMNITCFENKKGKFTRLKSPSLEKTGGMWHAIEAYDFDGDGDEDYLVGNLGLNNKFKKGEDTGFHLFCNDFDENGSNDIVLSKEKNGKMLPVRGRECSSEQMPFIAQKFPTFHEFASAGLEDIYTPEKLEEATHFEIQKMESIYLENGGEGNFIIHDLPRETQTSVINDFIIRDFDSDGIVDVVSVGNKYETEVETARYDAGIGLFMKGSESGKLTAVPYRQSGLAIRGNMRFAEVIHIKNKPVLIVAINNGSIEFRPIQSEHKTKNQ